MDSRKYRKENEQKKDKKGTLRGSPKLDRSLSVSRGNLDVDDARSITPMPGKYPIGIRCSQIIHKISEKSEINIEGVPSMVTDHIQFLKECGIDIEDDEDENLEDDLCILTSLPLAQRTAQFCEDPALQAAFNPLQDIDYPSCITRLVEKVGNCIDSNGNKIEFCNFKSQCAKFTTMALYSALEKDQLDVFQLQKDAEKFELFKTGDAYYLAPRCLGDVKIFDKKCSDFDDLMKKVGVVPSQHAYKYYNDCKNSGNEANFIGWINNIIDDISKLNAQAVGTVGSYVYKNYPDYSELTYTLGIGIKSTNLLLKALQIYPIGYTLSTITKVIEKSRVRRNLRKYYKFTKVSQKKTGSRVCSVSEIVQEVVSSIGFTAWADTQDIYIADVLKISTKLASVCWFDYTLTKQDRLCWCALDLLDNTTWAIKNVFGDKFAQMLAVTKEKGDPNIPTFKEHMDALKQSSRKN